MKLGITPNYAFNQTQIQRKANNQPQTKPQISFGEELKYEEKICLGGGVAIGALATLTAFLWGGAIKSDKIKANADLMQKDLKHTIELNEGVDPYKGFEVKDFTNDRVLDYQLEDAQGNRVLYDIHKGTKTTTSPDNFVKVEKLEDIVE